MPTDRLEQYLAKLRPAWHAQAACKGKAELMVPPEGTRRHAEARRICAECPVRSECLAEALADPTLVGIWGGTTTNERRRLRSGRRGLSPAPAKRQPPRRRGVSPAPARSANASPHPERPRWVA